MKSNAIYIISFFLSFVNFLIFYSYPFHLEALNMSQGTAGIVVGIATVLTLIMRLLSGYLLDRFKIRWGLFFTALLYSGALLLINSSLEWEVITGRLVLGALLGVMSTVLMYYSIISSKDNVATSRKVSLVTFFNVLPTCLAPFIALQLTQLYGVSSATMLAAPIFSICLVVSFFLDRAVLTNGSKKASPSQLREGLKEVSQNRNVITAISILSLIYITSGTTVTFLPGFFLKAGTNNVAWYFLMFSICMMLPRILLKKHMPTDSSFPFGLLTGCVLLSLLGNLSNWLFAGSNYVLIGAFCNGTMLGIIYPVVMAYAICCVDRHLSGTLTSVIASAADIGVIGANLLLGLFTVLLDEKIAMLIPIIASTASFGVLLVHTMFLYQPIKEEYSK